MANKKSKRRRSPNGGANRASTGISKLAWPRKQPHETEERFRAIADFTYDWETLIGLDGTPLWINPAVERMTGYSVEECLAMPDYPLPLIVPEDRDYIGDLLSGATKGVSGNDVTFRIQRKDGSPCWAAVSWQPIHTTEGAPLGVRTSVRDITERKEAEVTLQIAHQKAEQANLAKSKFLAAASHDLRQPLQAMGMFLSTLKFTATDPDSLEIIENLDDCLKATNDLLNALLEISRLDAGMLKPELSDFLVEDLIDQLKTEYNQQIREKGLELRTIRSTAAIRSDPMMIERILRNLVSNAVKHTTSGRILVGCRRRGDNLEIQVWDTGQGIPPDKVDRIFEEFYQIGNPERDRDKGLGLGLSIVRRVADLLGHLVTVSSEPGKGSRFSILVPMVAEATLLRDEVKAPPIEELTATTILVIDDDTTQLQAMKGLFSYWGCRMMSARSAEQASAILAKTDQVPDLILADYRLAEGLTGADAIRRLQGELKRDVPGVILTGDTEPSRLREARKSGFKLLHKPIDPDELKMTLGGILHAKPRRRKARAKPKAKRSAA